MPSPLDSIVDDIRKAVYAGAFYSAISTALTLPEICACLEAQGGSSAGQSSVRYRAWYDTHVAAKYPSLTALDCYSLRCGVLHQGRMGHARMQYARVLFTIPDGRGNVFHNNIINDALNIDATIFCEDLIASALDWYGSARTNPIVQQNVPMLVQLRPNGLEPYMVGVAVIS